MFKVCKMLTAKAMFLSILLLITAARDATGMQSAATPAADEDRVSTAFEFYPADTGFGSYFSPTIAAGEKVELTTLIGNVGEVSQDIRTYPVNAFTKDGGGLGVAEYGLEPNKVTTWLDYPEEVYTLEVGEGVKRTFSVSVPDGTRPGQYITAIAAEQADARDVEGSPNFKQKLRYAVPVLITVPGDAITGFNIGDIAIVKFGDRFAVQVQIQNTGDVLVKPKGTIEIVDQSGNYLTTLPVQLEPIYARDETVILRGLPTGIDADTFQINVNLTDDETGERANAETTDLEAELPPEDQPPPPIAIASAAATPGPSIDNVQFVTVEATISNTSEPIDAQLSLLSYRDGEQVERFPISQSLSLPQGETPITTRYIPLDGWTSGEWTFELLLETIDPATGAAVVIESQPIEESITIP